MPELPEVEVLRRSLATRLPGEWIEAVVVRDRRLREPIDSFRFGRSLVGRQVESLGRRAKYLLVHLDGGVTLLVHLGMSGRLTLVEEGAGTEAHEHVTWLLRSARRLRLRDPRRFGLVAVARTNALAADPHLRGLGPEPLGEDFGPEVLAAAAARSTRAIKLLIMDPAVVVGVGNIYACEALFRAGIDPRRPANKVSRKRLAALALAIRATLAQAIEEGGTTLNDFADGAGNPGYFQVSLAVYGREGEPCQRCERPIRRLVLGQRSSFFCPACQR
jgi:formamidopyrimidine-DNA glycosylase